MSDLSPVQMKPNIEGGKVNEFRLIYPCSSPLCIDTLALRTPTVRVTPTLPHRATNTSQWCWRLHKMWLLPNHVASESRWAINTFRSKTNDIYIYICLKALWQQHTVNARITYANSPNPIICRFHFYVASDKQRLTSDALDLRGNKGSLGLIPIRMTFRM